MKNPLNDRRLRTAARTLARQVRCVVFRRVGAGLSGAGVNDGSSRTSAVANVRVPCASKATTVWYSFVDVTVPWPYCAWKTRLPGEVNTCALYHGCQLGRAPWNNAVASGDSTGVMNKRLQNGVRFPDLSIPVVGGRHTVFPRYLNAVVTSRRRLA